MMTTAEFNALAVGDRVTVKSGKTYECNRAAGRDAWGVVPEPIFQQWRTGEAKYPAGRLYGPAFVRLKPENCTRVAAPVAVPAATPEPEAAPVVAPAPAPAPAPKATARTLTAALRRAGYPETVVQGRGYVYLIGGESHTWYTSSIPVCYTRDLDVARIVDIRNQLAAKS